MKFTFGIITSGGSNYTLIESLKSILALSIPSFEIIVVGGASITGPNLKVIPFDETCKPNWITRKKNLITTFASFNNIVYSHDYFQFHPQWYEGFLEYGEAFSICTNQIENLDGTRWHDWVLWPDSATEIGRIVSENRQCLIPYNLTHLSKSMYIPGSYWVAKKDIMSSFPLDETLSWGEAEDVEWSVRVRKSVSFSFNPFSKVRVLKLKPCAWKLADQDTVRRLLLAS